MTFMYLYDDDDDDDDDDNEDNCMDYEEDAVRDIDDNYMDT